MAHRIDTVAGRDKLTPRREPYWHRISKGCYLGFRKMSAAALLAASNLWWSGSVEKSPRDS